MTYSGKWIVTYTKHLKQKRKTYHDGILQISDSGDKVLLYDDCEKLIDSRFLKKGEMIESGGTLTFEAHLVDIGSLEGDKVPITKENVIISLKLDKKAQALQQKENEKGGIGKMPLKFLNRMNCRNRAPLSLEMKKVKFTSIPHNSLSATSSSKTKATKSELDNLKIMQPQYAVQSKPKEWNVLYTTQITQKAKKYHDGILRLLSRGSHMTQVMLLSEDGSVLSSKYLETVECVKTGNKLQLPNHLVEIFDMRTSFAEHLPKVQSTVLENSSCSSNIESSMKPQSKNVGASYSYDSAKFRDCSQLQSKNICKTCTQQVISSCSSCSTKDAEPTLQSNKPVRNALQILHNLKKPLPDDENSLINNPMVQTNGFPSENARKHIRNLSLQGGDSSEVDSTEYATQTSLSKTPDTKSTLSQNIEGLSAVKCSSGIQAVREPSDLVNEMLPVQKDCLPNQNENIADISDKFLENNNSDTERTCAMTWNASEIRDQSCCQLLKEEDIKQDGKMGTNQILDASTMISDKLHSGSSSIKDLLGDDLPTFDLGF
ncbi:protein ZGRF1-like isoform X2 [Zingiber officinale]|uniref:protein ZGRF1-like isoform X2 n=1 Tax=Zingiber officinale TaxID=94328 RepID=UPI001C4DB237|nr:protein ZGRF1-like isoform X2 [Zingiber officinale]